MARLDLSLGKQSKLLNRIATKLELDNEELAKLCEVHPRTFRDWRREKYKVSESALRLLCNRSGTSFPKVQILHEFWSTKKAGRLGALARYRLYGNPGTPDGRQRGGRKGIQVIRQMLARDPHLAHRWGFVVAKEIKRPRLSPLLAEFVGILIGDGGIRNGIQVVISFNQATELAYAQWIQRVVKRLFGLESFQSLRKDNLGGDVVVSSVKLVKWLEKVAGLRPGNKLRNGLNMPAWIWERRSYQIACLRGLMDTDGSFYLHRYKVNGKWYAYPKLCFCSMSDPLRQSVMRLFKDLGFSPRTTATSPQVFRVFTVSCG